MSTRAETALHVDARALARVVADLDKIGMDYENAADDELSLEDDLIALHILDQSAQVLASIRKKLAHRLGSAMPDKRLTVEGYGTFERHRRADRKEWDREALLHDVLDTRLADVTTGEIRDESPLEKVLDVWSLGAPRVTALRARGLDVDDYCHVERGGWTIQTTR